MMSDSSLAPSAVLIVDDDVGTCETFGWALRRDGYIAGTAGTGADALALAARRRFDLLLVDWQLPDMSGTDVARAVVSIAPMSFILMSAFLTTSVTVEAMRLGAATVAEKPMTIDALCGIVSSVFTGLESHGVSDRHAAVRRHVTDAGRPGSLAERWATYVVKGCTSPVDLVSIGAWARHVGASTTSVSESCRLLGVHPRDARDLMRLLRALRRSGTGGSLPETELLVSDARTLNALFDRAGVSAGAPTRSGSLDQFLEHQRLVRQDNEGLKALRVLLQRT